MSLLEVVEEIVGGTLRRMTTTSKVFSCELEAMQDAFGNRLYLKNLPGANASYFNEDIFYEVPRGTQFTGGGGPDNPVCAIPCNTPYQCRRDAYQMSSQNGDVVIEVRCSNPCSQTPTIGEAYTNIVAQLTGVMSATTTYSNEGLCFDTGQDSSYQIPGASVGLSVFDVEPQCVDRFSNYVLQEASLPGYVFQIFEPCLPSSQGFICNPFIPGALLAATPAMSLSIETCPELICEDFICLTQDPADPFGVIVVSECGCANINPGSSAANNTAGERLRIYRRNVQSNVTLTVTEP